MFKEKAKGYVAGFITASLLASTIAFAAPIEKAITALYNDIKIYVDGVKIDPKDANGKAVEPFIYDGTTYLPVRAVGEALDKTVTWDGATQSVYLGLRPDSTNYLLDVLKPYQKEERGYIEFDYSTSANIGWKESITMGGKKYHKGFKLGTNPKGYAIFNLDGKYSEVTAAFGIDDGWDKGDSSVEIWKDGVLSETITAKTQTLPRDIKINVTGVLQLKLSAPNAVSDIAFGEVTIK